MLRAAAGIPSCTNGRWSATCDAPELSRGASILHRRDLHATWRPGRGTRRMRCLGRCVARLIQNYAHRDVVLFAIDCGATMHDAAGEDEVPLLVALRAAVRLMEMKLVSSHKDHVGVLLWNTVRAPLILGGVTHGHRNTLRLQASHGRVHQGPTGQRSQYLRAAAGRCRYVMYLCSRGKGS